MATQAPISPHGHHHAIYPPAVTKLEVIDYVNDNNGLDYSRDIGRSFMLNDRNFYIFGDTFCKNTAGEFVGVVNNTAALVPRDDRFCDSRYLQFNDDDTVKALVPLTTEEKMLQKATGMEWSICTLYAVGWVLTPGVGDRITLWGFGGVVELIDGTGRIWFEKGIDHGNGNNEYCGIGIAEIKYFDFCEKINAKRFDEMWPTGLIFGPSEPKVGSLSTIIEGEYVYLFSEYKGNTILARAWSPMTTARNLYRFWDGQDYVEDYDAAVPIPAFQDIPQGAVVRSCLFGKTKKYLFVGVSKWVDSKIQVGAAETLEGPWEVWPVALTQGINIKDGFRYCIYPHLFASHTRKGELLVTWSEQWPGGVIAGKLQFQTSEDECQEEECQLKG